MLLGLAIGDALGLLDLPSQEPENTSGNTKVEGRTTYLQGIGLTIQVWLLPLLRVC